MLKFLSTRGTLFRAICLVPILLHAEITFKMENLKLFVVILSTVFQIEFIVGRDKGAYHVTDKITNSTNGACTLYENSLHCDFSTPVAKGYERVDLVTGKPINLTIEGAPEIQFNQYLCCFKEIQLFNCKYISAKGGSKRDNSYRLWLKNSEATVIKDPAINYFKAEKSTIDDIYLSSVGEFDIDASTIGIFNANTVESMRSTIIGSIVKSLSLTIAEQCRIDIIDSKITSIENLTFQNTELSQVINTAINLIRSKSIIIEKGSLVALNGVVFGNLASESVIVFGTLSLINIKYSKTYPLDWMVVMPGGTLRISKNLNGNDSTLPDYTITNVTNELRPFEIIDVPKEFLPQLTLAVFLGISLLIICLLLLWIFKFSGKSIRVKKNMDEQKFSIIEKETDPAGNVSKNLYVVSNQEFPKQPNEEHHSDPESQQDYCEPDPNDLVNYTEPDGNVINKDETITGIKENMDKKDQNLKMTMMTIRPPKVPASLPSKKIITPKPIVPNKSFLTNINSKLIQAPPPPSRTVSSANGSLQKTPMKMSNLPPIRKMSIDVDESHSESQEEYDQLEDSDS